MQSIDTYATGTVRNKAVTITRELSATDHTILESESSDNYVYGLINDNNTFTVLKKWSVDEWIVGRNEILPIAAPENRAIENFIYAACAAIGIDKAEISDPVKDEEDDHLLKTALPISDSLVIKLIVEHSLAAMRGVLSEAVTGHGGNSLLLFFITETLLHAKAQAPASGTIDLSRVSQVNDNALFTNDQMTLNERIDAILGLSDTTSLAGLTEAPLDDVLKQTGLWLIQGVLPDDMSDIHRQLLVGKLSNDELGDIIARDIRRYADIIMGEAWLVNNQRSSYREQMEQEVAKDYERNMTREFALMKRELKHMEKKNKQPNSRERMAYLKAAESQSYGNLIARTRRAIEGTIANLDNKESSEGNQPETENKRSL